MAAPLIEATRLQFEHTIAEKEAQIAKREAAVCEHKAAIEKAREAIDEVVLQKLKAEREKIVTEEAKKARLILETDIDRKAKEVADLQEVLKDRDIKLAEAQKTQVDLLRKQRELDDARRELDLTVEKKVQESLTVVRDKAKQEAEGVLKLKVLEKEEQIASMQRQIKELKRRAEQGSQQLQGEVLELELEFASSREVSKGHHRAGRQGRIWGRRVAKRHRASGATLWIDTMGIKADQKLERRLVAQTSERSTSRQG